MSEIKRAVDTAIQIDGQVPRVELETLVKLASKVPKDQVIVEIGTYRGRSAVALALGSRMGNTVRVYTVDPHLPFTGVKGGKFSPLDMAVAYRNITHVGVGDLVACICLPSSYVMWEDKNIGLLFIDDDHTYNALMLNLVTWIPHIVDGGILAFHDSDVPGVARFLKELPSYINVERVGKTRTLTWYRKIES